MTGKVLRVVSLLICMLGIFLLSGCISMRSDFVAVGEEECFNEDFKGNLFAWNLETLDRFRQVKNDNKSFLRFEKVGGASLKNSLVSDFRMEFEIRLEAPVEADIAFAMINFRNYFNKRYCLIVEPTMTSLKVAPVKHSELKTISEIKASHSLNKWYKYEIVAVGNIFKVFKNNVLILDVQDDNSTIDRGNIWFEGHSRYSFTNVRICNLENFV